MARLQTGDIIDDPSALIAQRMTEDELLANVRDAARKLGWLEYHTHDSRRSGEGFPDLVLAHRTDGRIIFAELKRMSGKLSAAQEEWLAVLGLRGTTYVWRPDDWLAGRIEQALR